MLGEIELRWAFLMSKQSIFPIKILASPAWKNRNENPYNALLYDAMINKFPGTSVVEYSPLKNLECFNVSHWHWPEGSWNNRSWFRSFARAVLLFLEIDFARLKNTVFIWTFHNIAPHDIKHPRLAEWCASQLVRRVDGAVFLSKTSKSLACKRYPKLCRVKSTVIQHGDYRPTLISEVGKHCARQRLGIPEMAPTLGFVGRIRPYKQIGSLIKAFKSLEDPSFRLLISGKPDDSVEVLQALNETKNDPRIFLNLELHSEQDLQVAVEACDVVVFPYRDLINSGSVIYALSNNRPVLVPKCAPMDELAAQVGESSVLFFNEGLCKKDILTALRKSSADSGSFSAKFLSWDQIARQHLTFFSKVMSKNYFTLF